MGEKPEGAERRMRDATLAELLARANHLVGGTFLEGLKRHGLSAAEGRVLAALSENDALNMTQLATRVLFKQPTLTKVIDRMERARLVERRAAPVDRRCTLVELTDRGKDLALPLVRRARQHEATLRRTLGAASAREISAALVALIDRLSQLPRDHTPGSASV